MRILRNIPQNMLRPLRGHVPPPGHSVSFNLNPDPGRHGQERGVIEGDRFLLTTSGHDPLVPGAWIDS